jgi:hypothetical protein
MRLKLASSLSALLLVTVFACPVGAQVELNPDAPETYQVRSGDTLWDIAGRFLRDPWRWSQIWDANREIGDPNRIYPGDVLRLYYSGGEPRIGLDPGMRTVRLSPRVRVTRLEMPVPTIPIGTIQPFLSRPYVLEREQIDASPYVVSFPDRRVLGGTGDRLYVRSIPGNSAGRYHVVRPGGAYQDPESGDILGYKATYVADAVLERPGDPASLRIESMALETAIGDRVLPAVAGDALQNFFPKAGPAGRQGRIISVLNGVSQIGRHNVVAINLGADQGIEPGHVFDVYRGGEVAVDRVKADEFRSDWRNQRFWSQETWFGDFRADRWIRGEPNPNEPLPLHRGASRQSEDYLLPFERAGTLMVFRTFSRVSFALVMESTRAMHLLDTVVPPRI